MGNIWTEITCEAGTEEQTDIQRNRRKAQRQPGIERKQARYKWMERNKIQDNLTKK